MRLSIMVAAAALMAAGPALAESGGTCLAPPDIAQISMKDAKSAVATDKHGQHFAISFASECRAIDNNTHFVTHSDLMPSCLGHGDTIPTNKAGPCKIDKVTPLG